MAAAEEQEEGVVACLGSDGPRLRVCRLLATVTGGLTAAGVDGPPDQAREHPGDEGAQRALVQPSRSRHE